MVSPISPNSITGQSFEINLASEVPPVVLNSGVIFLTFLIEVTTALVSFSEKLKNDSPETLTSRL